MNKEKLEERIQTLEKEREAVRQSLLMYEGALQDCQHWLSELKKAEENGRDIHAVNDIESN